MILQNFVTASEIQNKVEMNPLPKELNNLHYFGYFSLISLARLKCITGKASESLQFVENFSYEVI